MRKNKLIRFFFNKFYKFKLPPMVKYWQTGDSARAKLVTMKDGAYAMIIEGEKHPLYGFPRGPVLFGPLARLKFLAKNLVFNEVWRRLEIGQSEKEIFTYLFEDVRPILKGEIQGMKYDMFPPERLCPAVRELWRGMTAVEGRIKNPQEREDFKILKEGLTFFLQEDDAYRFRLQWIARYINPKHPLRKIFYFLKRKPYSFKEEIKTIFGFLGNAEITPDMKGRSKLIEKVLIFFLDSGFGDRIEEIVKELNWNKVKLSKADTYYFRGKYFKVDFDHFDY